MKAGLGRSGDTANQNERQTRAEGSHRHEQWIITGKKVPVHTTKAPFLSPEPTYAPLQIYCF